MNENNTEKQNSFQLLIGLILAGTAILLIGAGRLGDSMITRQAEQEAAQAQWQTAAERMLRNQEWGKDLRTLAKRHPEYLLQTMQTGMRPERRD